MNPADNLQVSHRFRVSCIMGYLPNPVDIAFQSASGFSRQLEVNSFAQGGDNIGTVHLPKRVTHGNLVLERGVMTVTPLTLAFADTMSRFKSHEFTVIVMLMNHANIPVSTWTFVKAIPVGWSTSNLDANTSAVLVDTMEFAYKQVHWIGVAG